MMYENEKECQIKLITFGAWIPNESKNNTKNKTKSPIRGVVKREKFNPSEYKEIYKHLRLDLEREIETKIDFEPIKLKKCITIDKNMKLRNGLWTSF